MKTKEELPKKPGSRKRKKLIIAAIGVLVLLGAAAVLILVFGRSVTQSPKELLTSYVSAIGKKDYDAAYKLLDADSTAGTTKKAFTERYTNIYEGIEAADVKVSGVTEDKKAKKLTYHLSMESVAGKLSFDSAASYVRTKDGYRLVWKDALILPGLTSTDKVRISTDEAARGSIYDRNGVLLAGAGTASSVGIVPGKLTDRQGAIDTLSKLLSVDTDTIEQKLNANWVKDDLFVPIRTIKKTEVGSTASEEAAQYLALTDQLLAIPGVMVSDTPVRSYPLGAAGAHLVGYMQAVTADDLKEHAGEGYEENDMIGKSGMESLYEKELKGTDGHVIYIEDENGKKKTVLANVDKKDGTDIHLTIDANLQQTLYDHFKEDKSCSVAMNPYTGEVLALLSTPSFDSNDFILGMTDEEWDTLNKDEKQPMYNRFRQVFAPGSSFKPVIAAIGLDDDSLDPNKDYGASGLSWQKDDSWGSYKVTTLHEYSPATMENALIYSDNIYFAKAALGIGKDHLESALDKLGFNQKLPFEITMGKSQYANDDHIKTEIQLADSGYGQGEVLVNPLHLAALYTGFLNGGNVLAPRLRTDGNTGTRTWLSQAYEAEHANLVLNALKKVVSDQSGTGHAAYRADLELAGKTGTAEIKESQTDTSGTELGWFAVSTTDPNAAKPFLLLSMVEDVKTSGGSGYVVAKDKQILDAYLPQ